MSAKPPDLSHWDEEIPASALDSDWYESFAEWFPGFVAWSGQKRNQIAGKLGMTPQNLSTASKYQYITPGIAQRILEAYGITVPARFVRDARKGVAA